MGGPLTQWLGGRDTEERMHRFLTFTGGHRARTADGHDERPKLRNTWYRVRSQDWVSLSWRSMATAVILSWENHRLVRRFP